MSGSAAAEGEGPRASAEPQSLRTLRFGDRTISYDHEGDGGDDGGVGGRTSLGIEGGEGETQGRHTWNFVSQFKLMQLFSSSLTSCALARLPHCCLNLSGHILADANKAVDRLIRPSIDSFVPRSSSVGIGR